MHILFLLPYSFVPPRSGNQNLTFNLLKYVTLHAVCDLVLLVDDDVDKETVRGAIVSEFPTIGNIWFFVKPKGIRLATARLEAILQGYHPGIGRYQNQELATWLTSHLQSHAYDLIHFDMIHMVQYGKYCPSIPAVLVASDAYSMGTYSARLATDNLIQKWKLLAEEVLLRNYEKKEYLRFNAVCTVSEIDQKYLGELAPELNVRTIGIPIGEEYTKEPPRSFLKSPENEMVILCTGAISCPQGAKGVLDFLEICYPEIMKRVPGVSLTLLGRNPTPALKRRVQEIPSLVHIEYVDNYLEFLRKNWVYIYPQRCGSGLQTKVQQAMAIGLPVVGFEQAFGGLEVKNKEHCLIGNSMSEFGNYVTELLLDRPHRKQVGLSAAEHIRRLFTIENVGKKMLSIYHDSLQ